MAKKTKEIVITTNIVTDIESWKELYEDFLKANDYSEEDYDFDTWLNLHFEDDYDIEYHNLNKYCGDILAIADLGLWNGRRSAYQVIRSGKVNGIFRAIGNSTELYKFYCDRYDVKATLIHHDGTNFVLFREIKEGVNIQPLLDLIYNQEEIPDGMITRLTRSMKPYIKNIYGLK